MRKLALLCLGAAAVSAGVAAPRTNTGLYGKVMISPARPVCEVGVPCTRPADHLLLRFSRRGHTVASTRTHADGAFRVALAAGSYAVTTPAVKSIGRGLDPRRATVPRGRYGRINFTLDIGIR